MVQPSLVGVGEGEGEGGQPGKQSVSGVEWCRNTMLEPVRVQQKEYGI